MENNNEPMTTAAVWAPWSDYFIGPGWRLVEFREVDMVAFEKRLLEEYAKQQENTESEALKHSEDCEWWFDCRKCMCGGTNNKDQ